jgi:pilus assembly protein CpaE
MRILIATPLARTARAWADVLRLEPAFEVETVVGGTAAVQAALTLEPPDLAMLDLTPVPARGPSLPPGGVERRRGPGESGRVERLIAEPEPPPTLDQVERWASARPGTGVLVVSQAVDSAVLMRAMQAGVLEVLPAPATPAAVLAALRRQWRRRQPLVLSTAPRRGAAVLAVVGCKGGSGATFVAAQLAHALACGGRRRVLLIDLVQPFGDAVLALTEQAPMRGLSDVVREFDRLDADLLRASLTDVSPGVQVLAAADEAATAPEVEPAHLRRLLQLARSTHDHVVIDVGRAHGPLALQALDLADGVAAVLQLTLPFVRDALRLQRLMATMDVPQDRVRWVVNRHQRDGSLSLGDLTRTLGPVACSTLPNQYELVASAVNQGRPVADMAPRSPIARAIARLAAEVAPEAMAPAANPSARRLRWWRWTSAPSSVPARA